MEPKHVKIKSNQTYWLVRSDGGRLYQSFKTQGLVAIGYPNISFEELEKAKLSESQIKRLVEKKYPDDKRPGFKSSQIIRFYRDVKKGDIVVVPSAQTKRLSIGRVMESSVSKEDVYKKTRSQENVLEKDYNKTKKVKWIKEVPKFEINPMFYKLFFSHQTIVNADEYANYINSMMHDFYAFGDEYHLVFNINKEDINALNLLEGFGSLIEVSKKLAKRADANIKLSDLEEIHLSVNLNSPGKLELASKAGNTLLIAGALILFINGGTAEFDIMGQKAKFQNPGVFKVVSDFLDSGEDREIKKKLKEQLGSLDIKDPDDIVKLFNEINKK